MSWKLIDNVICFKFAEKYKIKMEHVLVLSEKYLQT